jgi:hypothetical protein
MGDKKAPDSSFDTCFESMPFARMRDVMGEEGVGSLCEALMKKAMKGQEGDWSALCRQMAERCKDPQGHGVREQESEVKSDIGESALHHNRGPENGTEESEGN